MIISSNENPYKKLLNEAKISKKKLQEYKDKMQALADAFEKRREELDEMYEDISYIKERYDDYICLDWINFNSEFDDIDYEFLGDILESIPEVQIDAYEFHFNNEDMDILDKSFHWGYKKLDKFKLKILYSFIKNNFRKSYEDHSLDLDNKLEFVKNEDEEQYLILGYLSPGTDEWQEDYDDTTQMTIDGKEEDFFDYVRQFPDEIFDDLCKEYFPYDKYIVEALQEIKIEEKKYVSIYFPEIGDHYAQFPVGIKKDIFKDKFTEFLKEEGLLGYVGTEEESDFSEVEDDEE